MRLTARLEKERSAHQCFGLAEGGSECNQIGQERAERRVWGEARADESSERNIERRLIRGEEKSVRQ